MINCSFKSMPHLSIVVFRYRSSYSSVEIGLLNRNPCARPTPQERRLKTVLLFQSPRPPYRFPAWYRFRDGFHNRLCLWITGDIIYHALIQFQHINSTSDKRARFAYSVPKSSMATVKPAWRSFDIRYLISRPSMSCTRSVTSICIYLGDIW